jgi:uncharacterized damage-inducible protein DinB
MLEGWLDWHRQTLLSKCAGLTGEQLTRRSAEPSTLSLLGLVRHMAEVECGWFREAATEQTIEPIFSPDDNVEGDFHDGTADSAEADLATYHAEVRLAREAVADLPLDHTFATRRRPKVSVRWVYLHMIEEYARHNGHADLLRQRIDGATGD